MPVAIAPSKYILAVSVNSFAYPVPKPAKDPVYFTVAISAATEHAAIIAVVANTHFLSAKPEETSPCIPAPINTEQHRTGITNQMTGLTLNRELQKDNISPIEKMVIAPNRRAASSIEKPIISGAIGM